MDVGILVEGQEGLTWEGWRTIARAVEQLGFESLWRSDHLMSVLEPQRAGIETWVSLAVAAVETRRVRFGPLVCPITFRHPSLLARMAASVDVLSGGRLVLGLGAGWNDAEHRAYGIPFPPTRERLERLEEGIEVILRLFGEGPTHYEGRYYQLGGAMPRPLPAQRPRLPLLIGGGGEKRTLRLVARYADEWDVPAGLSPEAYRAKSELLADHCRVVGRDPRAIRRSASTAYLVGRDETQLRRRAERLQRLIPSLAALNTAAVPDTLRSLGWRVGTPETIARDLRALGAVGAQRVILQHNDLEDFEALELLAHEVLPHV